MSECGQESQVTTNGQRLALGRSQQLSALAAHDADRPDLSRSPHESLRTFGRSQYELGNTLLYAWPPWVSLRLALCLAADRGAQRGTLG